jgi:hypothetical protein
MRTHGQSKLFLPFFAVLWKTISMFIVLLKFSGNKSQAGQWMEGHNEWIKRGLDDGVFLVTGNLQPDLGGALLAIL